MKEYNDDKKMRILDAAAELFAERPFHKVLLSDVARAAAVGKGTLYLYFESKDELYVSVLFREFSDLVHRLHEKLSRNEPPLEQMQCVVKELVKQLYDNATFFELLRGVIVNCNDRGEWHAKRLELQTLIKGVIQRGIEDGSFKDANPMLTAQYIPGIIRSVCLFRPENVNAETILQHATTFVLNGLRATEYDPQ